jgi:hypothetical protein
MKSYPRSLFYNQEVDKRFLYDRPPDVMNLGALLELHTGNLYYFLDDQCLGMMNKFSHLYILLSLSLSLSLNLSEIKEPLYPIFASFYQLSLSLSLSISQYI